MGLFKKLRRHAAVAGGDFGTMFKGVEIPPLPIAVQRVIAEINKDDPDIDELAKLISSATGIAAKVIQTVNSTFYSPRSPVTEVKQAVMFLGLKNIRSLSLAFAAMEAIPQPKTRLFDHEAFWIDSLLRAFCSRSFAAELFNREQGEEAFTASLIADVALPVLLSVWSEYYAPLVEAWSNSPKHLSELEREQFGWDHAQAGAWIIQSWGFPDELVCYIGAHNLSMAEIETLEMDDTIVVPMAVAALCPSVLKPDAQRHQAMMDAAGQVIGLSPDDLAIKIQTIQAGFTEVLSLFGLPDRGAAEALAPSTAVTPQAGEEHGL